MNTIEKYDKILELIKTDEYKHLEGILQYQLAVLKKQLELVVQTMNKQEKIFENVFGTTYPGNSVYNTYCTGNLQSIVSDYNIKRIEEYLNNNK